MQSVNASLLQYCPKFIGYMETNGPESIDLKQILIGREDPESFYWCLDEIASVVVGLNVAEQVKLVKLPCDWPRGLQSSVCGKLF